MRRDELEHLLRAAGEVLGETELVVIGSQAVLATAPDWELPPIAMVSVEADFIAFDDAENAKADLVDGVLAEGSMFHETHGIYAQGVGFETIVAPSGWRDRLIPYRNENTNGVTGWFVEIHALRVAKMVAACEKDWHSIQAAAWPQNPAVSGTPRPTTPSPGAGRPSLVAAGRSVQMNSRIDIRAVVLRQVQNSPMTDLSLAEE